MQQFTILNGIPLPQKNKAEILLKLPGANLLSQNSNTWTEDQKMSLVAITLYDIFEIAQTIVANEAQYLLASFDESAILFLYVPNIQNMVR